jgi:segregation and condensation protein A
MPEENIQAPPQASETAVVPPSTAAEDNTPKREHHEHIYEILTKQDEVTWQSIIFELIKSEKMDPWDINVSKLSKLYIAALKKLKEMNLRLSGKVLLAAALLLRIKSTRLVGEDLMEFDRLLASGENPEELYADENFVQEGLGSMGVNVGDMKLLPRTPQPRKRKVSVYDLIDALAIALNVRRRRILSQIETRTMNMPDKPIDISSLMDGLMEDVLGCLNSEPSGKLAFSKLVPGEAKKDKVYTFIPLLHLTNARKVDLDQKEHFGEIWIRLADPNAEQEKLNYELEMERKKDNAKKPRKPRQKKEKTEAAEAPKDLIAEAAPTEIQQEAVPETAPENINPAM